MYIYNKKLFWHWNEAIFIGTDFNVLVVSSILTNFKYIEVCFNFHIFEFNSSNYQRLK